MLGRGGFSSAKEDKKYLCNWHHRSPNPFYYRRIKKKISICWKSVYMLKKAILKNSHLYNL